MAKKLILGLTAVGAGLYYYDQNVQPIFTKNRDGVPVGITNNAKPSEDVRKEYKKLDKEARNFGSQLKTTVNEQVQDIRSKTDETVSSIKDTEMYNKWSQKLDSYQKDVRLELEETENKPLGRRLAAKYIGFVNSLGQTEEEKLAELASSTSSRQQEIKKDLSKSNQSWGSWWSGKQGEAEAKKDELAAKARKEKNSWASWGESKADEAQRKAESEKKSWFNWGSNKADEAKKSAKSAQKDLESQKNSWSNWGSAKADEAEKTAKNAKKDAEAESDKWIKWGSNKADDAQKAAADAKNDLSSTIDQSKNAIADNFEAGKHRATEEFNKAKANLDEWTKKAQNKANGVWGKREEDDLKKAKSDFQNAFSNLKQFGSDLIDRNK